MRLSQLSRTLLAGLLLFTHCPIIQEVSAASTGPTKDVPKPNKTVNNGVKFEKIHIPSVDSTFKEISQIDRQIVTVRDTLYVARKSVHTLINGDRPKFKSELQSLIKSGTISLTQKDGIPSLKYNKKQQTGRAFEVFQSLQQLERSIAISKSELPALQTN